MQLRHVLLDILLHIRGTLAALIHGQQILGRDFRYYFALVAAERHTVVRLLFPIGSLGVPALLDGGLVLLNVPCYTFRTFAVLVKP